jgi:hypothetical protein
MNGLSGARVLLLDDEPDQALPVISAFSNIGVPVAYFDATELPRANHRLKGVRLAILDMDLGVGGSDKNMASTLVATLSGILSPENGPYGVLIWTKHPDLKNIVAQYIHDHSKLPKPVFVTMLKKADFAIRNAQGQATNRFSIRKLSNRLVQVLAESSPLECMQSWEGSCFRAATNVTNSVAEITNLTTANLDEWARAWREETLKLLLVISRARAEVRHTAQNCISSIFLALNPLHTDRMDVLVESMSDDLSGHVNKIMQAQGGSAVDRRARVNTMLHVASDHLDEFMPGNLYVFGKTNRPSFMPSMADVLSECVEGGVPQVTENLKILTKSARLCGIEITPVCDHAQNKMGLSKVIAGVIVPYEHDKKIKNKAQFLKRVGPLHFASRLLPAGAYVLYLNSRYVATAKPNLVKLLTATARVRAQLLADIQSWASYQSSRQGVMLLP